MRRRGFTFIEILVVVGILIILVGITAPRLGGMLDHSQFQAASRDLVGLLRYARDTAVVRGDGCEVRFDPEGGRYRIGFVHLDEDGNPVDEQETSDDDPIQIAGDAIGVHEFPRDVFFTMIHSSAPELPNSGLPRIIFYPDGSATAGIIGIQNEDGRALQIHVFRTTGMAKVEKGKPIKPDNVEPLFYRAEI